MGYLSVKQIAGKWNISTRWINDLCKERRIPGAMKIDSYWAMSEKAEKPQDARIKTGKYIRDITLVSERKFER